MKLPIICAASANKCLLTSFWVCSDGSSQTNSRGTPACGGDGPWSCAQYITQQLRLCNRRVTWKRRDSGLVMMLTQPQYRTASLPFWPMRLSWPNHAHLSYTWCHLWHQVWGRQSWTWAKRGFAGIANWLMISTRKALYKVLCLGLHKCWPSADQCHLDCAFAHGVWFQIAEAQTGHTRSQRH